MKERFAFLRNVGALTVVLMLDDLLQLHESVIPDLIGASELLVYAALGVWAAWIFWRFRATVLQSEYLILLLAVGFGSISVVVDMFELISGRATVAEDGAKLLAISFWLLYFWRVSRDALAAREHRTLPDSRVAGPSPREREFAAD